VCAYVYTQTYTLTQIYMHAHVYTHRQTDMSKALFPTRAVRLTPLPFLVLSLSLSLFLFGADDTWQRPCWIAAMIRWTCGSTAGHRGHGWRAGWGGRRRSCAHHSISRGLISIGDGFSRRCSLQVPVHTHTHTHRHTHTHTHTHTHVVPRRIRENETERHTH
jgi:hypothetical protein